MSEPETRKEAEDRHEREYAAYKSAQIAKGEAFVNYMNWLVSRKIEEASGS